MSAIGIVIACHNESAAIGPTVAVCRASAPGIPVHVIADRCTDDTAEQARVSGATVWERRDGAPGKGAALRWFVKTAADALAELDAVLILDADSRLRHGAIEALADALGSGASAAQAFVLPLFGEGSAASVLAAYSELLSQAIDDRIRNRLGWLVPLRGTGMAFRTEVFRTVPITTSSAGRWRSSSSEAMGITPPLTCAGTFADVPATDLPWCRYIQQGERVRNNRP